MATLNGSAQPRTDFNEAAICPLPVTKVHSRRTWPLGAPTSSLKTCRSVSVGMSFSSWNPESRRGVATGLRPIADSVGLSRGRTGGWTGAASARKPEISEEVAQASGGAEGIRTPDLCSAIAVLHAKGQTVFTIRIAGHSRRNCGLSKLFCFRQRRFGHKGTGTVKTLSDGDPPDRNTDQGLSATFCRNLIVGA